MAMRIDFDGAELCWLCWLTARNQRRSVGISPMKVASKTRKRKGRGSALALLTVLALIVAPVCAPLCAARTCGANETVSASVMDDNCHHSFSSTQSIPDFQSPGMPACNSGEIAAVLSISSRADEQLLENTIVSLTAAGFNHNIPGITASHGVIWHLGSSSPHRAAPSTATLVLRI